MKPACAHAASSFALPAGVTAFKLVLLAFISIVGYVQGSWDNAEPVRAVCWRAPSQFGCRWRRARCPARARTAGRGVRVRGLQRRFQPLFHHRPLAARPRRPTAPPRTPACRPRPPQFIDPNFGADGIFLGAAVLYFTYVGEQALTRSAVDPSGGQDARETSR